MRLEKAVIATPRPTEPVEKSTGILVLGSARIGLRAAKSPEVLEHLASLSAQQVVNGVQHRPGMRLHRHAIVRSQSVEIERCHDAGHRGAACLVTADLQPVRTLADVVRVVDRPGRQPTQPFVEDLERFNVGRCGLQHRAGLAKQKGRGKQHPVRLLEIYRGEVDEIDCPARVEGDGRRARMFTNVHTDERRSKFAKFTPQRARREAGLERLRTHPPT